MIVRLAVRVTTPAGFSWEYHAVDIQGPGIVALKDPQGPAVILATEGADWRQLTALMAEAHGRGVS